jgi:hypothetical protein
MMTETPTPSPNALTRDEIYRLAETARQDMARRAAAEAVRKAALVAHLQETGLADMYVLTLARRDYAMKEARGRKRPSHLTETQAQTEGAYRAYLDTTALVLGISPYDLIDALREASGDRTAHDAAMALRARTNGNIG